MKNKITISVLLFAVQCFAQSNVSNPYASIGKEAKVLTLSNGRYTEFFDNDTLQRIGSVMFNTVTNKIEYFIDENDTAYQSALSHSTESSRWLSVDPKAGKFPEMSPYCFAGNNPIYYVDQDGQVIKPASDYSYQAVGDALLQVFKSAEITGALFNFNSNKMTGKVENTHYGLIESKVTYDSFKAFKKGINKMTKGKDIKFSKTELKEAYNAYQKINEDAVHEILVTNSDQNVAQGSYDAAATNSSSTTQRSATEGGDVAKTVNQFKAIEEQNKTTDGNGNTTYNSAQIKTDKQNYLNTETNNTGTTTYNSGNTLIDDKSNKSQGTQAVKTVITTE